MQDFASWLERKPAGPKPRKRIPRVSKRKQRQLPEYEAAKKAHLRDNPVCQIGPIIMEAGHKVRCNYRAVSVHHVRGRIGKLLCDRRYFLSACDGECHIPWIHTTHKDEAKRLGLLQTAPPL